MLMRFVAIFWTIIKGVRSNYVHGIFFPLSHQSRRAMWATFVWQWICDVSVVFLTAVGHKWLDAVIYSSGSLCYSSLIFLFFFFRFEKILYLKSIFYRYKWVSKTPIVTGFYKNYMTWLELKNCCADLKLFIITSYPLETLMSTCDAVIQIMKAFVGSHCDHQ